MVSLFIISGTLLLFIVYGMQSFNVPRYWQRVEMKDGRMMTSSPPLLYIGGWRWLSASCPSEGMGGDVQGEIREMGVSAFFYPLCGEYHLFGKNQLREKDVGSWTLLRKKMEPWGHLLSYSVKAFQSWYDVRWRWLWGTYQLGAQSLLSWWNKSDLEFEFQSLDWKGSVAWRARSRPITTRLKGLHWSHPHVLPGLVFEYGLERSLLFFFFLYQTIGSPNLVKTQKW